MKVILAAAAAVGCILAAMAHDVELLIIMPGRLHTNDDLCYGGQG
jgi:hypothetical protein